MYIRASNVKNSIIGCYNDESTVIHKKRRVPEDQIWGPIEDDVSEIIWHHDLVLYVPVDKKKKACLHYGPVIPKGIEYTYNERALTINIDDHGFWMSTEKGWVKRGIPKFKSIDM